MNLDEYSIEELYEDHKIREVAHIVGQQIYGIKAELIKKILVGGGWPEIPPTKILYGTFCWATKVAKID